MLKYLFSDIDGTLLQQGLFQTETINKIHNFINNGNHFFLATGRIDSDILLIQKYLKINPAYRISQNGAVITSADNTIISEITIPPENLEALTDYLFVKIADKKLIVEASFSDSRYAIKKRSASMNYAFTTPIMYDKHLYQKILHSKPILFLILSEDATQFVEIIEYIHTNFPELQVMQTSAGCLEILNKQATKGNAIEYLLAKLKITDRKQIYVVGDSYNDISMFNKFENSFVMNTSPYEVEKYANYRANVVGEVLEFIHNIK